MNWDPYEKLPSGLTDEAKIEFQRFKSAHQEILDEPMKISFTVLVWGPNPKQQSPVADKRREIRKELRRLGHNAMFSEEFTGTDKSVSEKTNELAQARAAHLIVALIEDAPGALAEVHDFCNDFEIAQKLYVLVPKGYEHGYSAKGALRELDDAYGAVFWYETEDLKVCKVASAAIRRVEARRQYEWRKQNGK